MSQHLAQEPPTPLLPNPPPQSQHAPASKHPAPPSPQPGDKPQPQQHKDMPPQPSMQIPFDMLICFLCEDPILLTVEVACGHAFCEYCLSEYLLVAKECPICGVKVREKKGAANKRMDEIVEEFCQYLGPQAIQSLKQRKQARRVLKQQRKIQHAQAGLEIDVRDEDYIWRRGRILRTFNRVNSEQVRVKFIVVEYHETEKKEEFALSCSRLARAGYFTTRTDIPKVSTLGQQYQERAMGDRKMGQNQDESGQKEMKQKEKEKQHKQQQDQQNQKQEKQEQEQEVDIGDKQQKQNSREANK